LAREEEGHKVDRDPRVAILDQVCDVEASEKPFGKRWHQEGIVLQNEHLAALLEGKVLALDVREEYAVLLKLPGTGCIS
jgi:hypothetical protein